MLDVNTYLITKDTLSVPIMQQIEPPVAYAGECNGTASEDSIGSLIGQALSLTLIVGMLFYFYLTR